MKSAVQNQTHQISKGQRATNIEMLAAKELLGYAKNRLNKLRSEPGKD